MPRQQKRKEAPQATQPIQYAELLHVSTREGVTADSASRCVLRNQGEEAEDYLRFCSTRGMLRYMELLEMDGLKHERAYEQTHWMRQHDPPMQMAPPAHPPTPLWTAPALGAHELPQAQFGASPPPPFGLSPM